ARLAGQGFTSSPTALEQEKGLFDCFARGLDCDVTPFETLGRTFDLADMSYASFRLNDREYDVTGIVPMVMPAMANLWCMLNLVFFVETDTDKRAFLSVDSVLLSGDF
ncbi:hypothetical protein MK139_08825, partial [bacterium]|nr:hypothetical protein [bacterium]